MARLKEKKTGIIQPLLGSVREYKKPSLITPLFMALEAFCECLIPWFAGRLITSIQLDGANLMQEILKYGSILFSMMLCLFISVVILQVSPSTSSR